MNNIKNYTNASYNDNVKLIDPLGDVRWDKFVNNHTYGSIYQHSSWMKVISLTYKQSEPSCFVLEDKNQNIKAALPCFVIKSKFMGTRIVSLPFTSYSDPLVCDKKDLRKLLDQVINKLENISASFYELRCFKNLDLIDDERLKIHNYHKIHILNIEDGFEKVKKFFHKDCIVRSVRKAVKCKITVRQSCSEQDLKEFFQIHAITRKRQGLPIQPYEFFKKMWEIMYPKGYFTLLLAELNRRIIAGIVIFKFKDTVSFEHGASNPKYLAVRPNHLILWKAIEMACSEGYRYFDFGKTPPENKGLLNFKRRWGAKMYDLPYLYYPEVKGIMSLEQSDIKHKLLLKLGKHMPLSLAKLLGRTAYHHLG